MMFVDIFYIFLAIVGLSFLIFIHELGHYFVARWVGMRVEIFSIGFGRPIVSWMQNDCRWQIGWIFFGGFVKIAGMEPDQDPYTHPGGFFSKSPWARIQVLLAGPLVNLLFALIAFTGLYLLGGREKKFAEFTPKIGWVDEQSALYQSGVRPGDEILAYDGHPFTSLKDHMMAPLFSDDRIQVTGNFIDYTQQEKNRFSLPLEPYPHPEAVTQGLKTLGILRPAQYILYDRLPSGEENPLPAGSPLKGSGIQYGDRIVWVNGERLFSTTQLENVLNDNKVLLTVERNGEKVLSRVPRVFVEDIRPDPEFREELIDWKFEAQLSKKSIHDLYTIPYNLTNDAVVEEPLRFIDKENRDEAFPSTPFSSLDEPLQSGDKIIAVNGVPIKFAYQMLYEMQEPRALIIVLRKDDARSSLSWMAVDEEFEQELSPEDLYQLTSSIGSNPPLKRSGQLILLNAVSPKRLNELLVDSEKQEAVQHQLSEQRKVLESIEDPEKRQQALSILDQKEKQLYIGLPYIQDRDIRYNPNPFEMFYLVLEEIWRTLKALVTGNLNPKWISGPIGILQVVHKQTLVGIKEGLFWLGAISLNLGILNLLPIPVLDGGAICFALFEGVTRRRIHPKTMEKLILPFAILLIVLFLFLTYNDLSRLLERFIPRRWPW